MSGFGVCWNFFALPDKTSIQEKKKCGINRIRNEIGLGLKLINLELIDAVNPTGNR